MTSTATAQRPGTQPHPNLDEIIDAVCLVARELEISAAIPVLGDTTGRIRVCPRKARLVQCLDAGVVELTRLKHERRTRDGNMSRGW